MGDCWAGIHGTSIVYLHRLFLYYMTDKIRNDLRCENCSKQESTTLLYWERYHIETGRISITNPSFVCDTCKKLFTNINEFFENRPILASFDDIANKWDVRLMGLTSKKRYEFSAFRNPYFKKKLHRIRFVWKKKKPNDPG